MVSNIIDVIFVHCENTKSCILVTDAGILIDFKLVHRVNALLYISVIIALFWNNMEVNSIHLVNAPASILVIVFGIVIDLSAVFEETLEKATSGMEW